MPVLVTSHSLQAFIIANNLALLCSAMATISLMYAGVTTVDISMRMKAFVMSIFFLNSSARTLAAAFALGMYATLVPAAGAAVTLTVIGTTITLLDVAWFTYMTSKDQLVLRKRMGVGVALKWFALLVLRGVLACLWPYVIIAGFLAYITLWRKRKLTNKERLALLLQGDKFDEEQTDDQDVEITFNVEFEDLSKHILERKSTETKTVWEMLQEKIKEKRKA
uniref:PGG domain-containing protein n=1 Tax=Aegilops tauschii subsp. strangulata TaxID=200361 RepID=A0A453JNP5_AEGTS